MSVGCINELTTFAAFTALLIFLAAIAGVALGHWLIDRHADDAPRQHHGLAVPSNSPTSPTPSRCRDSAPSTSTSARNPTVRS